MVTSEKQLLIEALKKGSVTVTFTKVNSGEIRVMPCTLNPEVLTANGIDTVTVESQKPERSNRLLGSRQRLMAVIQC